MWGFLPSSSDAAWQDQYEDDENVAVYATLIESKSHWYMGRVDKVTREGLKIRIWGYDTHVVNAILEASVRKLGEADQLTLSRWWKKNGHCDKCGDRGEWKMLALFCRKNHGRFAG